jgi:hypothetical protein
VSLWLTIKRLGDRFFGIVSKEDFGHFLDILASTEVGGSCFKSIQAAMGGIGDYDDDDDDLRVHRGADCSDQWYWYVLPIWGDAGDCHPSPDLPLTFDSLVEQYGDQARYASRVFGLNESQWHMLAEIWAGTDIDIFSDLAASGVDLKEFLRAESKLSV